MAVDELVAHTSDDRRLAIDMYKQGSLDWTGCQAMIPIEELEVQKDPSQPNGYKGADLQTYVIMASLYVTPNVTRKGFDDARVRRALSLAIDRRTMVETVTRAGDMPMLNFIPPGMGYEVIPTDVTPNCQEAKRLMAEAGYPGGKGFPVYELLFRTGTGMEPDIAPVVASQWQKCLGIQVKLAGMPMELWRPKTTEHNFDVTFDGWQGDYPHPHTFAGLLASKSSMNLSGYASPEMDALLEQGMLATDPAEFQQAYHRVEEVILRDMPEINMWFRTWTFALRPEWTGITPNVLNVYPLRYLRRVQ